MKKIALSALTLLSCFAAAHAQDLQKITHPVYDNQNKEDAFRNKDNMFGDMPQYNAPQNSISIVMPVKLTYNNVEKINLNDRTISLDLHQYDLTRNMPMMMYNVLKKTYRVDGGALKKL